MLTIHQAINRLRSGRGPLARLMAMGVIASIVAGGGLPLMAAAQSGQSQQQRPPEQQQPNPPAGQSADPARQQTGQQTSPPPQSQPSPPPQSQPSPQLAPGGLEQVPATPGQKVGDSGVIIPPQLPKEPPPVAPDYQAPLRSLPSAERVGVEQTEPAPLTLSEAISLALANNNDISTSRIDIEMARFDLKAARGAYDPQLSSEAYYEKRDAPVASVIGGGANGKVSTTDATGSVKLAGLSPWFGGNYQVDFSSSRSTTDNLFTTLNPQYPSALTFTYSQPLLRNLTTDDNRRRIEIAKKNLTLSDSQFRQRAIETITRVQQAYWDLAFALRNLQVQIDAVKQARTQVESNRRQVEQGTLAPIDIVAAETQVSTFEQNVYTAQEAVTRAENTLKTLILPTRTAQLWSKPILPVSPVTLEPPTVGLDEAVNLALANRPEIEQVETSAEINKINTRFFDNQTKPQIDLVGVLSTVGLAGTVANNGSNPFSAGNIALAERVNQLSELAGLPPLPPMMTGSLPDLLIGGPSQSFTNLFGFNYPAARIGLRFSLPVGNRTASANLGKSLAEGRRIENQREQLKQVIESEVRNDLQAVKSAQARLAAAASARSSAEQQFESEQRRFQAGLSTVFLVLQRQTELIAARGRELQAQTDLNKAIAEFYRATGSTLQVNNVTVRTDKDKPSPQLEQRAPASIGARSPR